MQFFSTLSFTSALLSLLFLASSRSRADFIYNWGPDIPTVYSDNSAAQVNLSDEAQSAPVTGSQTMTATILTTLINPGSTGPLPFSQGQRVAVGLDILDGTEHGNVSFRVGISGQLSDDGSGLSLDFLDGNTREVTVNGQHYTVSLLGPGTIPGTLQASIMVNADEPEPEPDQGGNGGNDPPPANVPEPSAVVLALMGGALSVGRCVQRRRQASKASSSLS